MAGEGVDSGVEGGGVVTDSAGVTAEDGFSFTVAGVSFVSGRGEEGEWGVGLFSGDEAAEELRSGVEAAAGVLDFCCCQ